MNDDDKLGANEYQVSVDWLTIATWKLIDYTRAVSWVRALQLEGWTPHQWLQYKGFKNKHLPIFYGVGEQKRAEHFILKISGNFANQLLPLMLEHEWVNGFYATRIDLERTKKLPEWWKPVELYESLKGKSTKAQIIVSETGSTLYLGNRKSDRFARLYEKEIGFKALRLEIELKGQHASLAWGTILKGTKVSDLYAAHLEKLPLEPEHKLSYKPTGSEKLDISKAIIEHDMEKRLNWLKSCIPTFEMMANDHTIGGLVRDIFYSLSIDNNKD